MEKVQQRLAVTEHANGKWIQAVVLNKCHSPAHQRGYTQIVADLLWVNILPFGICALAEHHRLIPLLCSLSITWVEMPMPNT